MTPWGPVTCPQEADVWADLGQHIRDQRGLLSSSLGAQTKLAAPAWDPTQVP